MQKHILAECVFTPNDDGSFTVRFVDLPITTEGASFEEAQSNAVDAVTEFAYALLTTGVLEQVLQQRGVTIYEGEPPTEWVPPQVPTEIGSLFSAQPHQLPVYA